MIRQEAEELEGLVLWTMVIYTTFSNDSLNWAPQILLLV
jgi:hypothetical protein